MRSICFTTGLQCERDPRCDGWLCKLFIYNNNHTVYEKVYFNESGEVIVREKDLLNARLVANMDCDKHNHSTMTSYVKTLFPILRKTEQPQRLELGSVDLISLYIPNTCRRYINVKIHSVMKDFKTISCLFDFIKTYFNYIVCFIVLCLMLKPLQAKECSHEITKESIPTHYIELKGLTKHLFYSYISPHIPKVVCYPCTHVKQETSKVNVDHDGMKHKDMPSRSNSVKDSNGENPNDSTDYHKTKEETNHVADNMKMVREFDRFRTYEKCTDNHDSIFISFIKLAKNGFYFNLEKNLSKCFCCGLEVVKWDEDVTIEKTHKDLSSECKFVTGKDSLNVLMHKDTSDHNKTTNSEQVSGANGGPENVNIQHINRTGDVEHKSKKNAHLCDSHKPETPLEQLSYADNVLFASARHPDLASRENRTSTFLNWTNSHNASINSLVNAGLYYTGTGDEVRCFQCGGGMRNWKQGDDPWMEHAYWFPDCEYVRQRRGQDFIDMARMGRAFERGLDIGSSQRTLQTTEEERTSETQLFSQHRANPRAPPSDIASLQIPDDLMVDSVANMGFDKEHVILALGHIRRTHSEGYKIQPEELIDYLLANPRTEPSVVTPGVSKEINEEARPKKERKNKKKSNDVNNALDTSSENKDISAILDENEKLKQQFMCKVCMDNNACVVFVPCGHMVTCVKCASALRKCAICRANIQGSIRAYLG
ncbi:hypothetical protein DPMN_051590 [Dreissena polymorpha]|uniref:RING-type domain-containing protein n=2 Tax=Dreissena polymorpha TaxID=45954 RepID=A0A9D4HP20_DREPO|nr:hypothetical protein DPMN_051590 [Dreissena polymorpha]